MTKYKAGSPFQKLKGKSIDIVKFSYGGMKHNPPIKKTKLNF